jgi:transposase
MSSAVAWACVGCGANGRVKERDQVRLVDLPAFGRPARLVWHKVRLFCPNTLCAMRSWTLEDRRIAGPRQALTDRAGRWATRQVGYHGRSVAEVAGELGCDWHTINNAVIAYGEALLDDDLERIGQPIAVGLDETLFVRSGPFRTQSWTTAIVDVADPRLLDLVEGRDSASPCAWFAARGPTWCDAVRWATLDLSGPYRKVFDTMLPDAEQIADVFHVVKLANQALDEVRRRVQNETLGHRGRKSDPLFRARRRLLMAAERHTTESKAKLLGLLATGDPKGEVTTAWHAREVVRQIYQQPDVELAREWVEEIVTDFTDRTCPPEIRRLGRTIGRWRDQIVNWHRAGYSNGPTEAMNNLTKRIKRVAFGMRQFKHFRIRALLYAGRPN